MCYKQSEIDNIERMNSFVRRMSNSGISQGPIQWVRDDSGSGRVYASAEYRRVEWTLWSIYNVEMLLGFRVKTKVDLVQCRFIHESCRCIYILYPVPRDALSVVRCIEILFGE